MVAATFAAGVLALSSWTEEADVSVATVRLSVHPASSGALDLYVPVVDWGIRFGGVRLPARLRLTVSSIDRRKAAQLVVGKLARNDRATVADATHEARRAIAHYLRRLVAIAFAAALLGGVLVALAVRSRRGPRLRVLLAIAGVSAAAFAVVLALLLPPRGRFDSPTYYAHGDDIPVALEAVESAAAAGDRIGEEVDAQLVGLARLVEAPSNRPPLAELERFTIASDLHNNVLALPTVQRAAAGGPLLFPGDLTDRGSPLEAQTVRRVVKAGHPFVFSPGNHDSDTLARDLARRGAIVLGRAGRLLPNGRRGPVVVDVAGVRIAGYESPNERRASQNYRDRGADITAAERVAFSEWLEPLIGHVAIVLVHEPELAALAIAHLRADPPPHPPVFVVGHTHVPAVDVRDGIAEINGGTVGAGGTGNLNEHQDLSLAVLTVRTRPFLGVGADLVSVDPGTGAATARHVNLQAPGPGGGP